MTPHELLVKGRELISDEKRWTHGVLARNKAGKSVKPHYPGYTIGDAAMKAKRVCAGEYEYEYGERTVRVSQIDPNPAFGDRKPMWVAAAKWDGQRYTDPLEYKSQAVRAAEVMLGVRP